MTFNQWLANPAGWNFPQKILHGGGWYPQVLGLDKTKQETDKLAGQVARFFVHGLSAWEIVFLKPGEEEPPRTLKSNDPTSLEPLGVDAAGNRQSFPSRSGFRGRPLAEQ